ncbi:Aerobic respiration control sensor protein ArcB [Variovorax sp. PBS-H4]|uniref:hybrid sensor histidine kinase/response regulator n=1 Tax=Variovorax sp. PBS-H4 TaxID=434008 RepID=UPI001318743D|nr:response regulator [Variovorax sp. PBS-H4]VTU18473.1 Aerobic respiration control sensor protein ArcB [Variovorax sp. PBS-H4]
MTPEPVISITIDRSLHTVLVVDDNPATRYATERVIRAAGFATLQAGTGTEALRLARQQVSAVVLDVHLPDLDGFQVCRELRALPATSTLPVVHLSATFVRAEDKVAGLNAGADAYLIHPVEPPILVATLQALIRARMAEEKQRSSEARFREIYDQAPIGLALITPDGTFADVNPAMVNMLGETREALIGQPVFALVPEDWTERMQEQFAGTSQRAASWHGEIPLKRRDGSWIRLEWKMSAFDEAGLRVAIGVDVSERFELENRRREVLEREQAARAAAERLSRTKDDFVAVLSHELRNPLNAIGGWVHLLRRSNRTPDQMERGLDAIDRSVKAQARLVADILDVSRISSGKLRLHREWVEPRSHVASAIEALSEPAAAKRVTIEFDKARADPPAYIDATRFQQIVWNLLSNAIKFSDDGGRVRIEMGRQDDQLLLSVQDFGRGIASDFLPHLFDRFSQSDSPDNRRHGGLGLGLSIVKNLVELHGGTISADSAGEERGTTLHVSIRALPNGDVPIVQLEEADAQHADERAAHSLANVNVLVVEDNADASEILTVVLAEAGAAVRLACDYESALQLLGEQWPDVLVSDIGMPGRDGYDLIREVRHLESTDGRPKVFAVAHTAFTRPQDHDKANEAGFDAHLGKPLQPHALLALLGEALATQRLRG